MSNVENHPFEEEEEYSSSTSSSGDNDEDVEMAQQAFNAARRAAHPHDEQHQQHHHVPPPRTVTTIPEGTTVIEPPPPPPPESPLQQQQQAPPYYSTPPPSRPPRPGGGAKKELSDISALTMTDSLGGFNSSGGDLTDDEPSSSNHGGTAGAASRIFRSLRSLEEEDDDFDEDPYTVVPMMQKRGSTTPNMATGTTTTGSRLPRIMELKAASMTEDDDHNDHHVVVGGGGGMQGDHSREYQQQQPSTIPQSPVVDRGGGGNAASRHVHMTPSTYATSPGHGQGRGGNDDFHGDAGLRNRTTVTVVDGDDSYSRGTATTEGGGGDVKKKAAEEVKKAVYNRIRTFRDLDYEGLNRPRHESRAMATRQRLRLRLRRLFQFNRNGQRFLKLSSRSSSAADPSVSNRSGNSTYNNAISERSDQYYIPPVDKHKHFLHGLKRFFSVRFLAFTVWELRTGWLNFGIMVLVVYLIMVNIFAFLVMWIARGYHGAGKECVSPYHSEWIGSRTTAGFRKNYEVAFALSWTTFSSVGYGAVAPSGEQLGCWGLRYLCAIEALVGMLYFGFCGAIFFAKIGRYLSQAQVTFSSTICIQYGKGVEGNTFDGGPLAQGRMSITSMSSATRASGDDTPPFPNLEFRIVNDKANRDGWEILDAQLECMVAINQDFATDDGITPDGAHTILVCTQGKFCEVPLQKRMFYKLDVYSATHPYFKRVWYVRHALDASSPLVKPEMRRLIRNRGCWPPEKNTAAEIRASLVRFSHMIVTLNGTSNLSDNGVFAEKKYKFEDVHIGWQFAKLLYYQEKKKTKERIISVDLDLTHDILPQHGGGHEQLNRRMYE